MSSALDDLDGMLSGSAPSAFLKADPVGSVFEGPIINIGNKQQQRDYVTGDPKTYDNGDPMWQIPVTIQTDKRDPDIVGDDGARTLYLKGKLLQAIKVALRNAGNGAKLREGGHLWVKFTGTEKGDKFETKLYEAKYTPGAIAPHDDLLSAPDNEPASSPAPATNAAAIAAKLAAAVATPQTDPAIDGLPEEHKAAIKNLTPQQAAAAQLEAQHKALRPDLYA